MSRPAMFQLTEDDQKILLEIARSSVRAYLSGEVFTPPAVSAGILNESCGIFVSIHKHGELRGCIGNVHASGPLYRTAAECAVSAAVGDPRFIPLTRDELSVVDFEISVLSPMRRVHDITEIEVGKHGLFISKRGCRGLLLPQIATAYEWDRITFLQETCRKAGLRPDDWQDGATIQCFSAFVFGEKQSHLTAAS
jgi:uncharacterized protein